jgi:hypothetical protein
MRLLRIEGSGMRIGKPNLHQNPSAQYSGPERILRDRGLSDRSKRALLRRWKNDLSAAVEGVPAQSSDTADARMLRRVSHCLLQLDAKRPFAAPQYGRG